MKIIILLIGVVILLTSAGCILPGHRGGGEYRDRAEYRDSGEYRDRGEYREHSEYRSYPEPGVNVRVYVP